MGRAKRCLVFGSGTTKLQNSRRQSRHLINVQSTMRDPFKWADADGQSKPGGHFTKLPPPQSKLGKHRSAWLNGIVSHACDWKFGLKPFKKAAVRTSWSGYGINPNLRGGVSWVEKQIN